ncbi:MAG: nucleotidyltransferase family protein [Rhodospirillales bacterium]|nr:MAG: nucleotidyltransferase family protein [Rhodospirillales bacterium]
MTKLAGIILAAGLSRRFSGNKLLASFRGETVICRSVGTALASTLDHVILVVGHQAEEVTEALGKLRSSPKLSVVSNPDYTSGQSSSIRKGIEALGNAFDAALFMAADQPLLNSRVIDVLIEHFKASGKSICFPTAKEQKRNPVIFANRFFPELSALSGDEGGRRVLSAHACDAAALPFQDSWLFADIDTLEDLLGLERL